MLNNDFAPGEAKMCLTKLGARIYAWRARRRGFRTEITDCGPHQLQELGGRYSVSIWKDDTSWMNQPRFGGPFLVILACLLALPMRAQAKPQSKWVTVIICTRSGMPEAPPYHRVRRADLRYNRKGQLIIPGVNYPLREWIIQ